MTFVAETGAGLRLCDRLDFDGRVNYLIRVSFTVRCDLSRIRTAGQAATMDLFAGRSGL